MNPWTGIVPGDVVMDLQRCISAIGESVLDPVYKVDLLCHNAILRVIFQADHGLLSAKALTEMDGMIK